MTEKIIVSPEDAPLTTTPDGAEIVRELRSRDRYFSFRLGGESIQRETIEWRAAAEIERLSVENSALRLDLQWRKKV